MTHQNYLSENSKQQFGMDIKSIVRMFSISLFSDPDVFIRELIANASDSCIRRQEQDNNFQPRDARLDIYYKENSIVFEDTGAGMTRMEIKNYLAVLGKSYAEEMRVQLNKNGKNALAHSLIGEFGLGFLSAFVVADHVVVETKSFQENCPSLRWACAGNEFYELEEAPVHNQTGTRILLALKPNYAYLLNPQRFQELILKFAKSIQLPIYFHPASKEKPINELNAPWYQDTPPSSEECVNFLLSMPDERRFSRMKNALGIIPIHETDLRGVLYIPYTAQSLSSDAEGIVDIYCKRMLVRRDDLTLVPTAVSIVRGCIDCQSFALPCNREDVIHNETYTWVQRRIKQIVIDYLKNLARGQENSESERDYERRHSSFRQIMESYGATLKQGALDSDDDEYFLTIADYIMLSSNKRKGVTLPQYMEEAKKRDFDQNVLFYNREVEGLWVKQVLRSQDREILNATDTTSKVFIERYAELKLLKVRPCKDLINKIFIEESPSESWSHIIQFYENQLNHFNLEINAKAAAFAPTSIPLLIVPGEDTLGSRSSLQQRKAGKDLRTVYVNVNNSLMITIENFKRKNSLDEETFHLVLHELFHNAMRFSGDQIELDHLFEYHEKVIRSLCNKSKNSTRLSEELGSIKDKLNVISAMIGFNLEKLNSRPCDVFVMRPYRDNSRWVFDTCIQRACEDKELNPVYPEDHTFPGEINEEIARNIVECGILIADITGASPNVMYEVGAAHMLGKAKQTILIARDLDKIPFDLKGFRIIPFGNDSQIAALRETIGEALEEVRHMMRDSSLEQDR